MGAISKGKNMDVNKLMDYMDRRIADKKAGRSLYNPLTLKKAQELFGQQMENCVRCGDEKVLVSSNGVCRKCFDKENLN